MNLNGLTHVKLIDRLQIFENFSIPLSPKIYAIDGSSFKKTGNLLSQ